MPADPLLRCPHCGALNEQGFDRCIRCSLGLDSGGAAPARSASDDRGVSDAAEAARAERRPPTSDPAPGSPVAPPLRSLRATVLLLVLVALVYAGQVGLEIASGGTPSLLGGNVKVALRFGAIVPHPELVAVEPWRMLSSTLVHFGLVHFAFNAWALLQSGRELEPHIGAPRVLVTFVVAGLSGSVASVVSLMVTDVPLAPSAGASGAIFGLMGTTLGLLFRLKNPLWKRYALHVVLFAVLFGFAANASGASVRINNAAHLGGLVVGAAFGLLFGGPGFPPARRRSLGWSIAAGIGVLLSVVSLGLAQLSGLPDLVPRAPAPTLDHEAID